MSKRTTVQVFSKIEQSSLFKLKAEDIDILDELQKLCDCIKADEEETDWAIGENGEFALDDLIVGAYWALTMCHAGQDSQSYSVMCSLGSIYKPGYENLPEKDTSGRYVCDTICDHLCPKRRVPLEKKKRKKR